MAERARQQKPDDIVVFWIRRDSECAECGEALGKGRFIRLEHERALCLSCADLDHLEFLPSGNTALTRRASKYSTLRAVVVRFATARKRYERQGILVEVPALERAEAECLADEDARAAARARAAERRAELDAEYVEAFTRRIAALFPGATPEERRQIAEHACERYSGRVGRTAAAKQLDAGAVEAAVHAHVRHAHTGYDRLLALGTPRLEARAQVAGDARAVLDVWRAG